MANENELPQLFSELEDLFDDAALKEYPDAKLWQMQVGDRHEILIELDADRGCLVFSGDLPAPPADKAAALNALLMQTNGLWTQTGGLRFALDADDGSIAMLWDVPIAPLGKQQLYNAISGFVERLGFWTRVTETGGPGEGEESAPLPGSDESGPMIRV